MERRDFISIVVDRVASIGLRSAPFSLGCDGTILCAAHEGAFLAAAIEFSRKRRATVTASWFVGATALWGYRPRDVPARVYVRVATLLTMSEREDVCGPENTVAEGVSDFWWTGLTDTNASLLARSLTITAPRFIDAVPLRELRRSPLWRSRKRLVGAVIERAGAAVSLDVMARTGLPLAWQHAATAVAAEAGGTEPTVPTLLLGEDAALCSALGIT